MRFSAFLAFAVCLAFSPAAYAANCVIGGCAGHICAEAKPGERKGMIFTCEWKAPYACYQLFGECGQLANGSCGWKPSPELDRCLKNPEKFQAN